MAFMTLVWLIVVVTVVLVIVKTVNRQLPPPPSSDQDRLLAQQSEQIERLEAELQRVKEQADFTEKLLTERGRDEPGSGLEKRTPPVD